MSKKIEKQIRDIKIGVIITKINMVIYSIAAFLAWMVYPEQLLLFIIAIQAITLTGFYAVDSYKEDKKELEGKL